MVIAVAITSQEPRAGFPLTLEITTAKLPKRSWARIGQIRTLSVERLGKRIARVVPEELERIVEGLNEIIAG
jgi:mRNA interferase MazF